MDGNDNADVAPKSKKTRSRVWEGFTQIEDGSKKKKAKCVYCEKEYVAEGRTGTSNLIRHTKSCKSRPVGTDVDQVRGNNTNKFDQQVFREKLAIATIRHGYSFSFVEHQGLRDVFTYLCGDAKPICRNTSKSDCLKLHKNLQVRLHNSFEKIPGRICLTSDMWTSCTNEGFLCLTAYYVENDWKLRSRILNFIHVPPPHNANLLFRTIHGLLKEWGIDKKIFTLTLDNASTNDCMQNLLRDQLCADNLLLCDGEFFHIRCCAHILNLIVQDGVAFISKSISKIRESVKYIKGSEARKIKFDECVKQCKIKSSMGLWLDVATRWNSTFLMLDRAILYKCALASLHRIDKNYVNCLTNEEWIRVEKVRSVLKPFYEITTLFSGSDYPTSNLYFKNVLIIHLRLLDILKSPDDGIREMAEKMKKKFDKYWDEYSPVLSIGTIFDPRFKLEFVKVAYEKRDDQTKWLNVKDQLYKLFKEYDKCNLSSYQFVEEDHGSQAIHREEGDDDIIDFGSFGDQESSTKSELDLYLNEPREDHEKPLDVLEYWKKNQHRFPILSMMARDILSIPITTVTSESSFSMGGRILTKWRHSLLPENAQALITTRSWLYGFEDSASEMNDAKVEGEKVSFIGLSDSIN